MEEILDYLNNYFYKFGEVDTFTINNGVLDVKGNYYKGQYIKIEKSALNTGVFKVVDVTEDGVVLDDVINETFEGMVYSLAIPRPLLRTNDEIVEFKASNKPSAIVSESFGSYSYSKATKNGVSAGWRDVFKEDLMTYRCIFAKRRGIPVLVLDKEIADQNYFLTANDEIFTDVNEFRLVVK